MVPLPKLPKLYEGFGVSMLQDARVVEIGST